MDCNSARGKRLTRRLLRGRIARPAGGLAAIWRGPSHRPLVLALAAAAALAAATGANRAAELSRAGEFGRAAAAEPVPADYHPTGATPAARRADAEEAHRRAADALASAQRRLHAARRELESFVERQLSPLAADAPARRQPSETSTEVYEDPLADHPGWLAAQDELARLELQQDELAKRFTPQHPTMIDAEGRLDEARREIEALRTRLMAQADESAPHEAQRPAGQPLFATPTPETLGVYRSYQDAYREAESAWLARTKEERAAWETVERARLDEQLAAGAAHGDEDAAAAPSRWGSWLVVALLIGGAVAAYIWGCRPRTYASASQAEADLGAPVLAILPLETKRRADRAAQLG